MKPELEEIKYIENYLLDRLSKDEKAVFENKLKTDAEFARLVKMQKLVMRRVQQIALKQSVTSAHKGYLRKQKFSFKNSVFKYSVNSILSLIGIVLIAYAVWVNNRDYTDNEINSEAHMVQPPLHGIDVPFKIDTVNAKNGAVLNYKTGSTVIVPSNAFVDEKGNTVSGNVELYFREFNDATDIFLAGIPMAYNQDGENMVLESAAMCEIIAFKDGKLLKIRQEKQIEIMQASYTENNGFNLYRFNKDEGKWLEKGKDIPLYLDKEIAQGKAHFDIDEQTVLRYKKPIKPNIINDAENSITINFEEDEFPELAIYKNVEFAIDKNDKTYNVSDGDIEWEDVYLKKGLKEGSFIITFTKGERKVSYKVYPAFRDKDYDGALVLYNKKLKEYNNIRKGRLLQESVEHKEQLLANRRQDSINKLIEARNANTRAYNKWLNTDDAKSLVEMVQVLNYSDFIDQEIKDKLINAEKNNENLLSYKNLIERTYKELIQARQLFRKRSIVLRQTTDFDMRYKLMAIKPETKQLIANKEFIEGIYADFEKKWLDRLATNKKIMRIYRINQFGIWNCDQPIRFPDGIMVKADFRLNNKQLSLANINYVDKNIRSIIQYNSSDFKQFKCNLKADNVIWTVIEGNRLIYYNDFGSIPEKTNGKAFTFNMKEVDEPLTDYETVKKIINDL